MKRVISFEKQLEMLPRPLQNHFSTPNSISSHTSVLVLIQRERKKLKLTLSLVGIRCEPLELLFYFFSSAALKLELPCNLHALCKSTQAQASQCKKRNIRTFGGKSFKSMFPETGRFVRRNVYVNVCWGSLE